MNHYNESDPVCPFGMRCQNPSGQHWTDFRHHLAADDEKVPRNHGQSVETIPETQMSQDEDEQSQQRGHQVHGMRLGMRGNQADSAEDIVWSPEAGAQGDEQDSPGIVLSDDDGDTEWRPDAAAGSDEQTSSELASSGNEDSTMNSPRNSADDDAKLPSPPPNEQHILPQASSSSITTVLSDVNLRISRRYLQLTWANLNEQFERMRMNPTPFHDHIALFVWIVRLLWEAVLHVALNLFVVYEEDEDTPWHAHGHSEGQVSLRNYTELYIHRDDLIRKYQELTGNWMDPEYDGQSFDDNLSNIDWSLYNEVGDPNVNVANPYLVVHVAGDLQSRFKRNPKGWWVYITKMLPGPLSSWDVTKYYTIGLSRYNLNETIQRLRSSRRGGGRLTVRRAAAATSAAGNDDAEAGPSKTTQVAELTWANGKRVWSALMERGRTSHLRSFGISRFHQVNGLAGKAEEAKAIKLANQRERARRTRPVVPLDVDWVERIARMYGGRYSPRMAVICDQLNRFTHFAIQKRVSGKLNALRIQASRTGSYKSFFLNLTKSVFTTYSLDTLDGKWKGETHTPDIELYLMDSVVSEHFDPEAGGLPMSIFEQITSGLVASLPKRHSEAQKSTKAPLLWTTQNSWAELKRFKTPELREMVMARHLQIELNPSTVYGEVEDLRPYCDFFMEFFKVPNPFNVNALSRDEMKLQNVFLGQPVQPLSAPNDSGIATQDVFAFLDSDGDVDGGMNEDGLNEGGLNDDNVVLPDPYGANGRLVVTAVERQKREKAEQGFTTLKLLLSLWTQQTMVYSRSTGADRVRVDRAIAAQEMEILDLVGELKDLAPDRLKQVLSADADLKNMLIARGFSAPWMEFD